MFGLSRRSAPLLVTVALAMPALPGQPLAPAAARAHVPGGVARAAATRPNIVLFLTDDQTMDSVAKMPYLKSRTDWISFKRAWIENALCCPSRAAILTGEYDTHNGVGNNVQSGQLNELETLPVWLQRAGYRTGILGKYLNKYDGSYVAPGWDDWQVPYTKSLYTQYNYPLNDNGVIESHGTAPEDYGADVVTTKLTDFIATSAAGGKPFFAYFTPTATHAPWRASPSRAGYYTYAKVPHAPNFNEADVSDKPLYVRNLPLRDVTAVNANTRKEWETALTLDDELQRVDAALSAAGVLDNTVVIFMTDNGFSFGAHRWPKKRCEYEECSRTPLLVRYPGVAGFTDTTHMVTNVDIAPTIAEIAGAVPTIGQDGRSLLPLVLGTPLSSPWRDAILLHWPGGDESGHYGNLASMPQFWGVRTANYKYVELDTGERELYDESADPYELTNVAGVPSYASVQSDLQRTLTSLKSAAGAGSAPKHAWRPVHGYIDDTDFD